MDKIDHHKHGGHHHSHATVSADAMTAKDPVCGMTVKLDAGKPSREHKGETYHFCSQKCHDKFAADPTKYKDGPPKQEPAPEGTVYTCPMHPEIVPTRRISTLPAAVHCLICSIWRARLG